MGLKIAGFSLGKKPTGPTRTAAAFGDADDDDDANDAPGFVGLAPPKSQKKKNIGKKGLKTAADSPDAAAQVEAITELDDTVHPITSFEEEEDPAQRRRDRKAAVTKTNKVPPPPPPPVLDPSPTADAAVDLSTALSARKHQEEALQADPSVYEYDQLYDSLKAPELAEAARAAQAAKDRKSRYMAHVLAAAAVRKKDAQAAEDTRAARERDAAGRFEDREVFVTAGYQAQQAERREREAAEEREREDRIQRAGGGGTPPHAGMTNFYRELLDEQDRRHAQMVQSTAAGGAAAADTHTEPRTTDTAAADPAAAAAQDDTSRDTERAMRERAEQLNAQGADIAVNENGQVVDKDKLLRGGLNVLSDKTDEIHHRDRIRERTREQNQAKRGSNRGPTSGLAGSRARNSQWLEDQYAQQRSKRQLDATADEERRQLLAQAQKSRKTTEEISSARERYLARKRARET